MLTLTNIRLNATSTRSAIITAALTLSFAWMLSCASDSTGYTPSDDQRPRSQTSRGDDAEGEPQGGDHPDLGDTASPPPEHTDEPDSTTAPPDNSGDPDEPEPAAAAWSTIPCESKLDCVHDAAFLSCVAVDGETQVCAEECESDADCPVNALCQLTDEHRDIAFCLPKSSLCASCSSDAQCGDQGACVALEGNSGRAHCLQRCGSGDSCTPGFHCDVGVCVPNAGVCGACFDADGDGFGQGPGCLGPDCDDHDPAVNPAAAERCDDRDWSCSGDPYDDLLGTFEHCGACGEQCPPPSLGVDEWVCDRAAEIAQSRCASICADGYASCYSLEPDCSTFLGDNDLHCGACWRRCDPRDNEGALRSSCQGNSCVDTMCRRGWAKCDGADRCNTRIDTTDNCGACGNSCPTAPGYYAACSSGTCRLVLDCGAGLSACSDQCVNTETDPQHCGDCSAVCEGQRSWHGDQPLAGVQFQTCDRSSCVCVERSRPSGVRRGSPSTCDMVDDHCDGTVDLGCPRYAPSSIHVFGALERGDLSELMELGSVFEDSRAPAPWGNGGQATSDERLAPARYYAAPRQEELLCPGHSWVSGIKVSAHDQHGLLTIQLLCTHLGVGLATTPTPGVPLTYEVRALTEETQTRQLGSTLIHPGAPYEERVVSCPGGEPIVGLETAFFKGDGVNDLRIACQAPSIHYTDEANAPWRILWSALSWQQWSSLKSPKQGASYWRKSVGHMVLRGVRVAWRHADFNPDRPLSEQGRLLYLDALGVEQVSIPQLIYGGGTW